MRRSFADVANLNRRQLESELERKHRVRAQDNGWFVEKIIRAGRNGFPDRFYAKGGRVVLFEWKSESGRLTLQQRKRHEELRRAGVEVYIVRSADEADAILRVVDRGGRVADTFTVDF